MLTCTPLSLCSWDCQVSGVSAGPAVLSFNFFSEQGSISVGSVEYTVSKHGPLSGHWTLEQAGAVRAEALKPNALFRSFDLRCGDLSFSLQAQSAFTRAFDLLASGAVVGTIRPAHAFTRRAFIECQDSVPQLAQLFAFWLVVITWKRAANNSNSASST